MFTQSEKENPMLKDSNYKDYDTDIERDITDYKKVCPICGGGKFRDNDICYTCQSNIRKDFIAFVNQYGNKKTVEYVIAQVEKVLEIL